MTHKKVKKLLDLFAVAYIAANLKSKELKDNEDAMEVIQVVMLIAVGVLAITAVWAGINGYLEQLWGLITGAEQPGAPKIGG